MRSAMMRRDKGWNGIWTVLLIAVLSAVLPVTAKAQEAAVSTDDGSGSWQIYQDGSWRYYNADGSYARDVWLWLSYNETYNWYHFNGQGYLTVGWLHGDDGKWYYLNPVSNGLKGAMQTGWLIDDQDGNCYYLETGSGQMVTGWYEIEGHSYYFNEVGSEQSGWIWDSTSGYWIYHEKNEIPLGVLMADGERRI